MTGKTHGQSAGILASYDFSYFNTVAEIGGGNGHLLRAVLASAPGLKGILFDLPHVIEQTSAVRSDRLEFQAGDSFKDTLPICDAYLMMQILHDWSDRECEQILKVIRRSAPPHAKLLLAEFMIPEDSMPSWTLFLDLIMLGELTGKERTKVEFGKLLDTAGFRLDRVIDVGLNTFILESSVI